MGGGLFSWNRMLKGLQYSDGWGVVRLKQTAERTSIQLWVGNCLVETDCWKNFNTAMSGGLFSWNRLLKGLQYTDGWGVVRLKQTAERTSIQLWVGSCSVETDCWKDFNTAMGGELFSWNRLLKGLQYSDGWGVVRLKQTAERTSIHRWVGSCSVETDCWKDFNIAMGVRCCQVEVSATSWSFVQRSPTDCAASLCVI